MVWFSNAIQKLDGKYVTIQKTFGFLMYLVLIQILTV